MYRQGLTVLYGRLSSSAVYARRLSLALASSSGFVFPGFAGEIVSDSVLEEQEAKRRIRMEKKRGMRMLYVGLN